MEIHCKDSLFKYIITRPLHPILDACIDIPFVHKCKNKYCDEDCKGCVECDGPCDEGCDVKIKLKDISKFNSYTMDMINSCLDYLAFQRDNPDLNFPKRVQHINVPPYNPFYHNNKCIHLRSYINHFIKTDNLHVTDILLEILYEKNLIEYGCGIGSSWIGYDVVHECTEKKKAEIIEWAENAPDDFY
jgi:hypothetical protein